MKALSGTYLCEPVEAVLRQFVAFAVVLQVGYNARPHALKLLQCSGHVYCRIVGDLHSELQARDAVAKKRDTSGEGAKCRSGETFGRVSCLCPTLECGVARHDTTRHDAPRQQQAEQEQSSNQHCSNDIDSV